MGTIQVAIRFTWNELHGHGRIAIARMGGIWYFTQAFPYADHLVAVGGEIRDWHPS